MDVVEFVAVANTELQTPTERDVDVVLVARLSDGREVAVLTDRGFGEGVGGGSAAGVASHAWAVTEDDLETCAWVVGPDERFGGHSDEDMAHHHWSSIAETLGEEGVPGSAAGLMSVPFRVVWGTRERLWPDGFAWF